ncbi:topB [Symbiodinium natans]|uniref:DNA topoisomerase n=1 Tax=Symbiodinium natans TaxID=878477 RepID=A0A812K822_9DINO|nr:topB [Symbiodinium natans]
MLHVSLFRPDAQPGRLGFQPTPMLHHICPDGFKGKARGLGQATGAIAVKQRAPRRQPGHESRTGAGIALRAALAAAVQLVIAEKPRVAQQIASALKLKKVGKHYEGKNMIVTSACGHLVQFQDPPWGGKLPLSPPSKLKAIEGKETDLKEIRQLASRADVLVNGCDAGREGELIFRRIREFLRLKQKPFQRLWLQSLTPDAIRSAMGQLKAGADFDNLAAAADCRALWDWLIGINGTRALRQGLWLAKKCSVGRVMTPTLSLVVDREKAIEDFQPQQYHVAHATFRASDEEDASAEYSGEFSTLYQDVKKKRVDLKAELKKWKPGKEGRVVEDSRSHTLEHPKPLFNLADVQRECSRLYGMTPASTLKHVQKLYEDELTTYPRTDSRYVPNDHELLIEKMLKDAARKGTSQGEITPEILKAAAERVRKVRARVFDDKKVTDHYAIIPTSQGLDQALTSKSHDKVLKMIVRHFLEVFLPPAKHAVMSRATQMGDYIFKTHDRVLVDAGFLLLQGRKPGRQGLARPLPKGTSVVLVKAPKVVDKETQPPQRYTQASLLTAMETCSKAVADGQLKQALTAGIGTSATRAAIIEKLIWQKWITHASAAASTGKIEKGALMASNQAVKFIADLRGLLKMPELSTVELTGEWELRLKQIQDGLAKPGPANKEIYAAVERIVASACSRRAKAKVLCVKKTLPKKKATTPDLATRRIKASGTSQSKAKKGKALVNA